MHKFRFCLHPGSPPYLVGLGRSSVLPGAKEHTLYFDIPLVIKSPLNPSLSYLTHILARGLSTLGMFSFGSFVEARCDCDAREDGDAVDMYVGDIDAISVFRCLCSVLEISSRLVAC